MFKYSIILIISASFFILSCKRKTTSINSDEISVCLSSEENLLLNKINDYRLENGLTEIPLSASLTKVAQNHAYDLSYNRPAKEECNMHSWSSNGNWKECCYTNDHKEKEAMWSKPSEITSYTGEGYEICFGFAQFEVYNGDTVSAQTAFDSWQLSPGHNAVMINKKVWKKTKWNAIGIGIVRDFVCVWFGEQMDRNATPENCK